MHQSRIGAALALLILVGTGQRAEAVIVATLEEPGISASGISLIRGWAYSTTPGASIDTLIDVRIDGVSAAVVPCCSNRGDVKAAIPQAPLLSGFGGVYNYDNLSPGSHSMAVVISSSASEQTTITTPFVVIRPSATFSFIDSVQFANGALCIFGNSPDPPYFPAQIECTGVAARKGTFVEVCPALNIFRWDRASQGFKLTLNECALP